MADPHHITPDLVGEVVTDALRRRVGRGKELLVEELAVKTGIDARTMAAYHGGQNRPSVHRLLRLAIALDKGFINEVLLVAGLGGARRLVLAEVNAPETVRELIGEAKRILDRTADGKFDHRERADTGHELIKLGEALQAQGAAMLKGRRR